MPGKREWDIPKEGNPIIISQSLIGSLELSPCRVTTIPEGIKIPPSIEMTQGTTHHTVIEWLLDGTISPLAAQATPTFIQAAELIEQEEGFFPWPADRMEWAANMGMLMREFIVDPYHWFKGVETVEAEIPHHRYLTDTRNGRPIWVVTGGIDRIVRHPEEGVIGIDFKTSGRGWTALDGSASFQAHVYAWLVEKEYGLIEDWRFLVGRFDKRTWAWHQSNVTRASVDSALDRIIGWAEYLSLDSPPHLCTPLDMGKKRGWWAKPKYNHGFCRTCRYLGDEWDDSPEWSTTTGGSRP